MTCDNWIRAVAVPCQIESNEIFLRVLNVWIDNPEHLSKSILRAEILCDTPNPASVINFDSVARESQNYSRHIERKIIPKIHRECNTFTQDIFVYAEDADQWRIVHEARYTSLAKRSASTFGTPSPITLGEKSGILKADDLPFFHPKVERFALIFSPGSYLAIDYQPLTAMTEEQKDKNVSVSTLNQS